MSQVRSRLVVAACAVLALAGCAVPGQPVAPGIASEYMGETVSNAQVDATFSAWVQESNGALVASRSEVATMELLHDALLAACVEAGTPIHRGDAARLAQDWFTALGVTTAPSEDFVYSFESQFAVAVLSISGEDAALSDIINSVAKDAKVSPRSGVIDVDAFLASVADAKAAATQQQLGAQSYIPFQHVDAFSDASASWIDRG